MSDGSFVGAICGPAKGTKDKPYRCICCKTAYSDIEAMAVSICWNCMGGNTSCAQCRKRGVAMSDFRIGGYVGEGADCHYEANGGTLHRFTKWRGSQAVMRCGKRIPRAHRGGGESVVPPCRFCWPHGFGY